MESYHKKRHYEILIYSKEDKASCDAAMKALTEIKKANGWERLTCVTILKHVLIPSIYHGEDLAIIMERETDGVGRCNIRVMS